MRFLSLHIFLLLVLSTQCRDSNAGPKSCEDIKTGILNTDMPLVKPLIDNMLEDLLPVPLTDDIIGHEENLTVFVEKLKNECALTASIECYGCIETLPVISHISIQLDSAGTTINRYLDIATPSGKAMTLIDIH